MLKLSVRGTHCLASIPTLQSIVGRSRLQSMCQKATRQTLLIRNVTVRLVNVQSKEPGDYHIASHHITY